MSDLGPKLSAYLDGELSPADHEAIARALTTDADLRAELDALRAANDLGAQDFAAMLDIPVPLDLARSVRGPALPPAEGRAPARIGWGAIAASVIFLAIGAGGGYLAGTSARPDRDWIAEVAQYHAVYARQTRHLAEVPASEAAHIVTWLSDQTGTPVRIPDLSAAGLTFEGARLLVAAGQPVGQLMYRDGAGQVIALCFVASDKPATDAATSRDLDGFDALVWGEAGARFILIGPQDYPALPDVAQLVRSI